MKPVIFAANWKLNKNTRETREYFTAFRSRLPKNLQNRFLFFVPATSLEAAGESLLGTEIGFGAQNCFAKLSGAFTGEISAGVVKDLGGKYILLGHSERRQYFNETSEAVAEKAQFVQNQNMIPVVCVGESLADREAGKTAKVIEDQLNPVLAKIDKSKPWVLAYEPVWAIGTGKVATVEQVSEVHQFLKDKINVPNFPILYGGSVKPDNAAQLLAIDSVNGFLVGGASLEVDSFLAIGLASAP